MTAPDWFSRREDSRKERREAISRDLSRRLRPICPDYTDDQFAELVETMTERQLKGEHRLNGLPELS
jgi:hypothetical protein